MDPESGSRVHAHPACEADLGDHDPIYQRFLASLRTGFRDLWGRTPDLTLEIEEEAILWRGSPVYRGESRAESLAFLFYKDGVRELTFERGFEEEELDGFVEVLHRARSLRPQDEDDLLTMLWTRNFSHMRYASVDLFAEGLEVPEPEAQPLPAPQQVAREEDQELEGGEESRDAAQAAHRELRETVSSISVEQFDASLYFLDETELRRLREAMAQELARDVRRDVLGALLDSLEETDAPKQEEILGILGSLLPQLLGQGELRVAADLLGELRALASRGEVLGPGARQTLQVLLNELSTPAAVDELMRAVEAGAFEPSADDLAAFLGHLRESALGPLIRAAAGIRQEELRRVVEQAVQRMAVDHRQALVEQLRSRDPTVAAGAARLVGQLRIAEGGPDLAALVGRPEPGVRLAAVEAAASLRSSDTVRALLDGLRDSDRQVRIAAARGLAALRYQPAGETLRAMIEGKDLREADLTEKLAIFEAYGSLNIPESVPVLDRILNGRSLLGRREPSELRACAAVALGRIKLPAARKALEKAESDDDAVVRAAVTRVLREEG